MKSFQSFKIYIVFCNYAHLSLFEISLLLYLLKLSAGQLRILFTILVHYFYRVELAIVLRTGNQRKEVTYTIGTFEIESRLKAHSTSDTDLATNMTRLHS